MTIASGEVLKVVAEFVLVDGVIVQNVYHFVCAFDTPQEEATVITGVIGYLQDLYEDIDDYVDENVTVNAATVHVVEFNSSSGEWETARLVGTSIPSITFAGVTDPLPHQCSAVLIGNTGRPKTRGRKFLPPFLDVAADGPDWTGAVITALGASLVNYITPETLSGGNLLNPGITRVGVDQFLGFTVGIVNSIVGTQRRRKPGVGV